MNNPTTNRPLYSGEHKGIKRAVFLSQITNPQSGTTTEYFAAVLTDAAGKSTRIGAIPTILPRPRDDKPAGDKSAGYELRNHNDPHNPNDPMLNFSDAADLAQGIEVVCQATGANGDKYWQIISPGELRETEKDNKKYTDFGRPTIATAYLREGHEFDANDMPNVESFYIHSAAAAADKDAHSKRDLKSWRQVPIEGSVNPRTGKNRWYTVTVKDALDARDVIAAGAANFTKKATDRFGNEIEVTATIGVPKPKGEAADAAAKPLKPMLLFTARAASNNRGGQAAAPAPAKQPAAAAPGDEGAALFGETDGTPLPEPKQPGAPARGR
jgi:hypothetical protein